MLVSKIIERAEKFRSLGRFDKKSAIDYINDALYDISKRNSIKREEIYYQYRGVPIELQGTVVKVDTVKPSSDVEAKDFSAEVLQDGKILLYKKDKDGNFQKIEFQDGVFIEQVTINYTGYLPVNTVEEDIDFPSEYETAIVYYLRSRILEEIGDLEVSQFFEQAFMKELVRKAAPKRDVISVPSDYSLL